MFLYELLIFVGIIALDLGSKVWVCNALGVVNGVQTGEDIDVIKNVISFHFSKNTGASWGLFQDRAVLLAVFTGIAMLALLVFLFLSKKESKFMRLCLVMILGGGVGNFFDRVAFGYVRDFIYTDFIKFPTYNVADSFLTVATVLIAVYAIFIMPKEITSEQKELDAIAQATPKAYPYDSIRNCLLKEPSKENLDNTKTDGKA